MHHLTHRDRIISAFLLCATLTAAACEVRESEPDTLGDTGAAGDTAALRDTAGGMVATERANRAGTVEGFKTPESVLYDRDLDAYFVSNINGNPSAKDNNGFIAKIAVDGMRVDTMFIAGGRNNVTLNAPKGMTVRGDTLWVTDIDAVRAFNKRTAAPITSVDFAGQNVRFLNDIAAGPDGALYITDTGIRFSSGGEMSHPGPDRIFKLAPNRQITVAAEGDSLGRPNGITWDAANDRFIVVPFGAQTIFAWQPSSRSTTVLATGPGSFDGVEVIDGRVLVSSWADSSIHELRDGRLSRLITGLPSPADIGVDTRRNRVLVPLFQANRVEIWQIR